MYIQEAPTPNMDRPKQNPTAAAMRGPEYIHRQNSMAKLTMDIGHQLKGANARTLRAPAKIASRILIKGTSEQVWANQVEIHNHRDQGVERA